MQTIMTTAYHSRLDSTVEISNNKKATTMERRWVVYFSIELVLLTEIVKNNGFSRGICINYFSLLGIANNGSHESNRQLAITKFVFDYFSKLRKR